MGWTDQEQYEALEKSLTNHTPSQEQIVAIEEIREWAKDFGKKVIEFCPSSRERSLAITHLEETVMWAVKSIVLED